LSVFVLQKKFGCSESGVQRRASVMRFMGARCRVSYVDFGLDKRELVERDIAVDSRLRVRCERASIAQLANPPPAVRQPPTVKTRPFTPIIADIAWRLDHLERECSTNVPVVGRTDVPHAEHQSTCDGNGDSKK